MPPVAMFFGLLLVVVGLVMAVTVPDLEPRSRLARALGSASSGRLVAMAAALALYPPLSTTATLSVMRHPWWLIIDHGAPALRLAFAFGMLCAVQTGIALVLLVASIPTAAVYGAMRRIAAMLPAAAADQLRRWTDEAERLHQTRRAAR